MEEGENSHLQWCEDDDEFGNQKNPEKQHKHGSQSDDLSQI